MPAPEERFHSLDACRAAAMLLGVVLHAAASFFVTPVGWAVRDPAAHIAADLSVGFIHTFRMPVFFLLSGFFARLLYLRLGPGGFARHRLHRILLPFLVGLPLLIPTLKALWRWGVSQAIPPPARRFGYDLPPSDMGATILSPPGHLWFLYYLVMLLAIVVGVVWVLRHQPTERLAREVDRFVGAAIKKRYFAFVVAAPTSSALLSMNLPGIADTPLSFVPQPRILAYYGIFLTVGWWLHRRRDLLPELGRRLWIAGLVGVAAIIPFAQWAEREVLGGTTDPLSRLAWLYLGALFSWELVLLFIGLFVRYLARPRRWVRWLSDASYWCYLAHLPLVVVLQVLVARLAWPGPMKFAVITGGAIVCCLVTYQTFVRYTFIGRALNGKRTRFDDGLSALATVGAHGRRPAHDHASASDGHATHEVSST